MTAIAYIKLNQIVKRNAGNGELQARLKNRPDRKIVNNFGTILTGKNDLKK